MFVIVCNGVTRCTTPFYNNFAYKQGFNNSNYDNVCVQLIETIKLTLSYNYIYNKTKHYKKFNLNVRLNNLMRFKTIDLKAQKALQA